MKTDTKTQAIETIHSFIYKPVTQTTKLTKQNARKTKRKKIGNQNNESSASELL